MKYMTTSADWEVCSGDPPPDPIPPCSSRGDDWVLLDDAELFSVLVVDLTAAELDPADNPCKLFVWTWKVSDA